MNKEELVQEVAKKAKVTQKEVADILSVFVDVVEKTVSKGKKVTLVGFGTFESRKRAERTGRNPQTGKEIKIPAKTVPTFTAGKKFKEMVNK
ncbi:MAG: DNA-binding protein [Candidatus Melainabacteria bacterium RIFOXYA2_FULL_32_9]|nr:MAG: DNA-binding protein [Candidatus Melainabacteria bacterium RIFOXYA2_FULL_32_9]